MSQIMIIGISGLDADLLRVYGPSLPNLRRLMLESPFLELQSTIPPEPVPAWGSVYTGLNPANHGLLEKMDCLERNVSDLQPSQAEMFWESAVRAGKRVCVLNPLLVGPDRSNEGFFLSSPSGAAQHTFLPGGAFPSLLDEPLIPPASQLTSFCDSLRERTERQVVVALEQLARESWDLFFVQLDALDHIQHFLWRYSDPSDPTYPGKNEHANSILEFYRLFDQIVGRFRAVRGEECVLAIVSSYGHKRRCIYRLHINEWLRTQSLLTPQSKAIPFFGLPSTHPPQSALPMHPWRERLGELLTELIRRLPWFGEWQRPGQTIDQQRTIAQLVELASATSSYGGIKLNRAQIEREQRDYEQVRMAILTQFEQLCVKDSPVVNWVRKREQCYQGKQIDRYPDILFELRSDFGVGRSLGTPLVVPDSTHRLVSGAHSAHGVFLLENWPEELETLEDFQGPTVMDVAPTLLRLLDVESTGRDGQALVRPRSVRQLI